MKVSIIVISKNEKGLRDTLASLELQIQAETLNSVDSFDLTVVDASNGELALIAESFPSVQWIDFVVPDQVRVSIPHQRNRGIRDTNGEIIVFIDAGCIPQEGWLRRLITPLVNGSERMTCGPSWVGDNVYSPDRGTKAPKYVKEAGTINLAFTRELANDVGDFDESFEYGSDVDFTRRAVASGAKIRFIEDAVVEHDWGSFSRQLKRSRQYGAARIRLAMKHSEGLLPRIRSEPVPVLYALFLIGLPLVFRYRSYLLLLTVPLWRARNRPYPLQVVVFHLAEGIGCLQELTRISFRALGSST